MRLTHLVAAFAAGVLLGPAGIANAHGTGGGGGGNAPASPPGFDSGGNHSGFDQNPAGSPLPASPRGWDQGKADWKTDSADGQSSGDATLPPDSALAPGFAHH